jgi:glycosyltransferase involved in cell wall biosynthesis
VRVVQVVATDAFAGVERYVAQTAAELARRGCEVVVLGGEQQAMTATLNGQSEWRPAAGPASTLAALAKVGRVDVVNAHLTYAEAAATLTRSRHHGAVVSTRHLLAERGHGRAGHLIRQLVEPRLDAEVRVSSAVTPTPGIAVSVVIPNGVEPRPAAYRSSARTILMVQRLEPEKSTDVGLKAWQSSGLAGRGWSLAIAGDGSERRRLEASAAGDPSVTFLGHVADVSALWPRTAMLLAPTGREAFGLAVLEAMAVGVPVVAARAGGHIDTVGSVPDAALFAPGDVSAAADLLQELACADDRRGRLGAAGREVQQQRFSLDRQVDALLEVYEQLRTARSRRPSASR